jgi:peroxiredoxin
MRYRYQEPAQGEVLKLLNWFFLVLMFHAHSLMAGEKQTLPPVANSFPAPAFELRDIDGKIHHIKDYRGKVVVLNFWATWCPPCRYEMPSMERARKKLLQDKVVILAVNVGENEDTIFEFTGNYPVEFPLLMDQSGNIIKQYPVVGLPTTYIINPQGIVTHRAVGSREWDDNQLLDQLRHMSNNK